jgi:transcriptional regulator with XRE-family HTH domain
VSRRTLSGRLRRLREATGLTATDVARRLGIQTSTVTRWERGDWMRPDPRNVEQLLDVYGVTDEAERASMVALAAAGHEEGWWHLWRSRMPAPYPDYIALEAGASKLWTCDPQHIPPLLQTEDYARASMAGRYPHLGGPGSEPIEEHVMVLRRRQRLLTGDDPLEVWAVIDATALLRPLPGLGAAEMAAQLAELRRLGERPNVVIQILPWEAGTASAVNPFTILRFRQPMAPEAGWVLTTHGAELLDDEGAVRRLEVAWSHLLRLALPRKDSMKFLEEVAGRTNNPWPVGGDATIG